MTAEEAKEQGYTHHAEMYGFKGFYYDGDDEEHTTFMGVNWFNEKMSIVFCYIDVYFEINEGFPILIKEKL